MRSSGAEPRPRTGDGSRIARRGLAVGAVGLVLCAVGVIVEPRQALTAYLFAYATVLTIVLGALMQLMLSDVTGAHWFDELREHAWRVTAALPVLAVLALPIFVGVHSIYPWSTPAWLPVTLRAVVARKHAWLNVPFFVGRGVGYLAVWLAVHALLRRSARRRDAGAGVGANANADADAERTVTRAERRVSAIGLVACGLTLTFAAFDWLMSLEPAWYSTVYGVYVFAGGVLSALGLLSVLRHFAAAQAHASADAEHPANPERVGAVGKLLLSYAMFWAYIAFAQYLIIWIADVPADARWYVVRGRGSWGALALVVGTGQFVIPFALLLSRAVNRDSRRVALIGAWLLLMHVLDVYWLVLPALHPAGIRVSWLDAAALLLVGGVVTAASAARAPDGASGRGAPDARLDRSG